MTRIYKFIIVLALLLSFVNTAFSVPTCTTPPTCTSNSGGDVGGALAVNYLISTDSRFNALTFTPTVDFDLSIRRSDIRLDIMPYKIWQTVTMGDSSLSSNINVNFYGADSYFYGASYGMQRTLNLGTLNLDHVNAIIDTNVTLRFAESNNAINLENSAIKFTNAVSTLSVKSITTAPLTITSISGNNELEAWFGQIEAQSTTIDVQSGSTLLFDSCGLQNTTSNDRRLYFRSPVTGSVNNAAMNFTYGNVYFNSSAFNFTNNSTLALTGSYSKVEFDNVSFDTSTMTLGNNTTFVADELTLANATMTINSGARAEANIITVTDTTTLAGSTYSNTGIYSVIFDLKDNITFNQNGSRVTTDYLYLRSGSQLNVDNAIFVPDQIWGYGGTVNLTNGGKFYLAAGFHPGLNNATFNIDATSKFYVNEYAVLKLDPTDIIFNNSGEIYVYGNITDRGTIAGSGTVYVYETGLISPHSSNLIGTITFENAVTFSNSLGFRHSLFQSQYIADIEVTGGVESNDLLQYDDNNFDTTLLSSIKVYAASTKTADELNGKSFTIISSLNAGSTGSLVTGGSYPAIVEGSNVPALIDFTISNESTNGNDDITLNAAKQGASSLLTHPSVNTGNKTNTANLLIHAANNGNTVVNSALNALTNGQVSSHFNSLHAEPYSSHMTVSLEQIDLVQNSVMSHASSKGIISPGKSYVKLALNSVMSDASSKGMIDPEKSYIKKGKDGSNNAWMDVLYVDGDVDGENQLGGFDYELTTLTIGQDIISKDNNIIGAYFSFGTQKMDEHDLATQDLKGNIYHLGMYSYIDNLKNWNVHSVLGYSYGDHESKRYVSLGSQSSEVDAEYDSHAIYTGIKGGFTWIEDKRVTLSPEIGVSYAYYTQSSFQESGDSVLGLIVDKATAQSIITSAGLNAQFASILEDISLHPQAFFRYEHDWYANSNDKHEIDAALISYPQNKQEFVGRNRGEHAAILGIGVASNASSSWQINGGLVGSLTSHGKELGAGVNLKYKWD